ncbi:MAG: ribulose-phosphate 3-epimerase [Candidatus Omnitrophica bacterium]|nr:ribulose-phosphate 3-epimerase [Candidatus Omnitrophota bacterium]
MPSLLAAPFDHLGKAIRDLEDAGAILFHYDVMDGHFVPNLSGSPHIIEDLQRTIRSRFDVHLMTSNPERVIPWFDLISVRSISIHAEASKNIQADFEAIRSQGKSAGVVINPPTPMTSLDSLFEHVDQVLIMTVFPGLGGQRLIKDALKKIEYCAQRRNALGLDFAIQVDGGVKEDTIRWVFDAGATEIVSGSAIFERPDPAEAYRHLNRLIGNEA